MRFKVGDRVRIKSIDWYNENKDNYGSIYAGNGFCFWKNMARLCGEIMKITSVKVDPEDSNKGYYFMENSKEKWTDEMIEGLVEEEIVDLTLIAMETVEEKTIQNTLTYGYNLPEGYIFKDENGNVINARKIVLEKKKPKYPTTYEECCEVLSLGEDGRLYTKGYKASLIQNFQKLLICRDAYWKIAGEEMGLGKPWEPDWTNLECDKFCIWVDVGDITLRDVFRCQHILAFPTAEMRDAFYENFKELIESCKELL